MHTENQEECLDQPTLLVVQMLLLQSIRTF